MENKSQIENYTIVGLKGFIIINKSTLSKSIHKFKATSIQISNDDFEPKKGL